MFDVRASHPKSIDQEELIREDTLLVRQPAMLSVCKRVYKSFFKKFKPVREKFLFM